MVKRNARHVLPEGIVQNTNLMPWRLATLVIIALFHHISQIEVWLTKRWLVQEVPTQHRLEDLYQQTVQIAPKTNIVPRWV
jgi:hypothetical protein